MATAPLHIRTPLLRSNPLSALVGGNVFLKMDAMQPSGSFKLRGVGLACQRAVAGGASSIVSSSGGNAGLASAYAARALGVPATIVVPTTTPSFIRDRLEAYGAKSIVHGSVWDEANKLAVEIATSENGFLMHPFDNPVLWEGHATLVHEVADEIDVRPDLMITVCGGGGLAMGILRGLKDVGWDDVPVLIAETRGADSMAQSLAAGHLVTLPGIDSIAKTLGATRVSEDVFETCKSAESGKIRPWVTSDAEAVNACINFANDHRVLVEPACGAGLAALYQGAAELGAAKNIVVEVCGGAITDLPSLEQWGQLV